MKRVELLAPAGDMDSLLAAVNNGADAVYIGGKKFGARKFAHNFDAKELKEAIQVCHTHGARLYVTVNTLIHDTELEDALQELKFLYEIGVDAVIIQDIGLIRLARKYLKNLELHASTQMHTTNEEALEELKELGIKRAVLAREMTKEEIASLDTDLELEVFVHGALCVSYSGQCLFSSMVLNRSGNRGECAGMCRLPYRLKVDGTVQKKEGSYLLSPKELMTLPKLKEILDLDKISSLKIEGRMKNATYVGYVTKLYRTAIDAYYNRKEYSLSTTEENNLKSLFNREFTLGHFFQKSKKDLMNPSSPNHLGSELGKVTKVTKDKIQILLTEDLYQEDGIRFANGTGMVANKIYQNGFLVREGKTGSIVEVDNKVNLTETGQVRKTYNAKLEKEMKEVPERKQAIQITVEAIIGKPLKVTVSDGTHTAMASSYIVEKAKTAPVTKERIAYQMEKLGGTSYVATEIHVNSSPNAFIPIGNLNDVRRKAIDELERQETKTKTVSLNWHLPKRTSEMVTNIEPTISVSVKSKEQLEAVLSLEPDRVYVTDEKLYQEYRERKNVYYRYPKVHPNYQEKERVVIGELGGFTNNPKEMITDYSLNAYNHETVHQYLKKANLVGLSVELTDGEIETLLETYYDVYGILPAVELLVYGRTELMMIKNDFSEVDRKKKYELEDRNHACYPLEFHKDTMILYHSKVKDEIDQVSKWLGKIRSFRIDLLEEDGETAKKIVNRLKKILLHP